MRNVMRGSQVWLLGMMVLLMAALAVSCKTVKHVEKDVTVVKDSVMVVDTIVMETHTMVYDTTYVYDSYREAYVVGKIDTIEKIRVDTLKVETTKYIYKERKEETTDSVARVEVNQQKQAATKANVTEKVVEKPVPLWKKAMVVMVMIVVAASCYVIGNRGSR